MSFGVVASGGLAASTLSVFCSVSRKNIFEVLYIGIYIGYSEC